MGEPLKVQGQVRTVDMINGPISKHYAAANGDQQAAWDLVSGERRNIIYGAMKRLIDDFAADLTTDHISPYQVVTAQWVPDRLTYMAVLTRPRAKTVRIIGISMRRFRRWCDDNHTTPDDVLVNRQINLEDSDLSSDVDVPQEITPFVLDAAVRALGTIASIGRLDT